MTAPPRRYDGKKGEKMTTVYMYGQSPQAYKEPVMDFETEKEAEGFCESLGWEITDENGFAWNLDYAEATTAERTRNDENGPWRI